MRSKDSIVITNVDSFLGYSTAYRFLEEWNRTKKNTEFRLLCRSKQGLHELEKLGGKLFVLNYTDKDSLKSVLHNVYYAILVPEASRHCVEVANAVISEAKIAGVDYLAMYSMSGIDNLRTHAESKNDYPILKNLFKIEDYLGAKFGKDNSCVFRTPMFHQFFYFYGPQIDDENCITLPISESCKWSSVDLQDVVDAVFCLSKNPESTPDSQVKKNKFIFEFTSDKNFTAKELVNAASKGLDRDVHFQKVSQDKFIHQLDDLRHDNRFRERPDVHPRDRSYTFPLGRYLTKEAIETFAEYWSFTENMGPIHTTTDLKDSLDGSLRDICDFFKRNKEQFRHIRQRD